MENCRKCNTAMVVTQETMRHSYNEHGQRKTTISIHYQCVVCGFYLYTKEVSINEQVSQKE